MWVGGVGRRILILWLCPYMSTYVLISYVGSDLSHIAATEVPMVAATPELRHERTCGKLWKKFFSCLLVHVDFGQKPSFYL